MLLLSKNDNEYVPPSISFPAPYYLMLIKEKKTLRRLPCHVATMSPTSYPNNVF